jgi:hypothetical protein
MILKFHTKIRCKREGNITNRLKFSRSDEFSYSLIGVYDGDMNWKIDNGLIGIMFFCQEKKQ